MIVRPSIAIPILASLLVPSIGCLPRDFADDSGVDASSDAGRDAAERDAFVPLDAPVPDADSGPLPCGPHEHRCDGVCVLDSFTDSPAYGCLHACPADVPCAEPEEGMRVYCDDAHQCAYGACLTCETLEAECGTPSDECGGALDCGVCDPSLRCEEFACVECDDGYETSAADPRYLGSESDIPDSYVSRRATLHDASDVDWYLIDINDRSPRIVPGGGPPNVTITVSGLPEGIQPALDVTFACDSGTLSYTCGSGDTDEGGGTCSDAATAGETSVSVYHNLNCLPNDDGASADGPMLIRVSTVEHPGAALCGEYRLEIRIQ